MILFLCFEVYYIVIYSSYRYRALVDNRTSCVEEVTLCKHCYYYYYYYYYYSVGFETNLNINSQRKKDKYQELLQALNSQFSSVKFVNLSVSCLGIFGRSADSFIDMCKELEIDKSYLRFIIRKTSNIIIRSTYFIFCRRNKPWNSPDLISF